MTEKSGHCLCGAVRFTVKGEMFGVVSCHCKDCQRLHGNYNPMMVVNKTECVIDKSEHLGWFDSSEAKDRGFCNQCGSAMFMRQKAGEKILISAGAFDDTSDFINVKNIFTEDATGYYAIAPESTD